MANVTMKDAFKAMNEICGDLPYTADDRYYETLDNISIAIVNYRIAHHLSQQQLADYLRISQAMVSKYESGDYNISWKALFDLFDKLAIPFELKFNPTAESEDSPAKSEDSYPEEDVSLLFGAA